MIVPVLKKTYEGQDLVNTEMSTHDFGVSFADLLSPCEVAGHLTRMIDGIEKCVVCWAERKNKKSPWIKGEPCYECEESCIISQPLDKVKCPNCGYDAMRQFERIETVISEQLEQGEDVFPIIHTDNKNILMDCQKCGKKDQIVAEAKYNKFY